MVSLERLAELIGRPVVQLTRLDNRVLAFAFLDDAYEVHSVRDDTTGEVVQLTTTTTGDLVEYDDLAAQSRSLLRRYAAKLDENLQHVLRGHPEIPRLHVAVRSSRGEPGGATTRYLSGRQVQSLAMDPDVQYVELLNDPVIRDKSPD